MVVDGTGFAFDFRWLDHQPTHFVLRPSSKRWAECFLFLEISWRFSKTNLEFVTLAKYFELAEITHITYTLPTDQDTQMVL